MHMTTPLALGLALLTALSAGCSASEPGVKNTFGNLSTRVNADPAATTAAAENVLRELELLRVHADSTDLDGKAFGYTASDRKVSVSIKKQGEGVSRVKVRVGWSGDEDLGLAVIRRIEDRLGKSEGK